MTALVDLRAELFDAGVASVIVLGEMVLTEHAQGNLRNAPRSLLALHLMSVAPFLGVFGLRIKASERAQWIEVARAARALLQRDGSEEALAAVQKFTQLAEVAGIADEVGP